MDGFQTPHAGNDESSSRGAHVLYADSVIERGDSLATIVQETHPEVRVHTVESANGARDALADVPIDVLVARQNLPETDGTTFLMEALESYPSLTTFLYSEVTTRSLVREVRESEITGYVPDTGNGAIHTLAGRIVSNTTVGTERQRAPPASVQLETFAEVTPDAIITIDEDSTVEYVNPAIENILGYTPDELVGRPLTVLMSDTLAERHRQGFERYLTTDERHLDWDGIELLGVHADGHDVPLSVSFSEFREGGSRYFTGVVRDITERKRREEELQRREAMLETARDGVYARDDEGEYIDVNQAYADLVGSSREELLGRPVAEVTGPEIQRDLAEIQSHLRETDEDVATYQTQLETGDEDTVPIETRVSLFPLGDDRYGRVGVVRDVTERRHREDQLVRLNETAQALTSVETAQNVAEMTVSAAVEVLNLPITAVRFYDEETGKLRPVSRAPETTQLVGEDPLFTSELDFLETVYFTNINEVFDDLLAETDLTESETELRSAIVLPIGNHGVFVSGATEPNAFSENDVVLANILVANVHAALQRTEREAELRMRKDELETRTTSLERVNRTNAVIRDLTRALTQATTRAEIEETVCTQLANSEPYRFAWIGEQETVGGDLVPKASAGVERGYLDQITVTTDEAATGQGPAGRAVRTHEPQAQNNLHTDPPFDTWRAEALQRGYRASIAVPLVHMDTMYGVLNLYADEPGVFDDLEVEVLGELGEMIGFAINALERKKALVGDEAVELEFSLTDPSIEALAFTRETGSEFEFETLVEQADASLRAFFTIADAEPESVVECATQTPTISDVNFLSESDGRYLFEATVSDDSFLGTVLEYGAHPTELTATPEEGALTVELPRSGDVRAFLETFLNSYPEAELTARRELDRPIQTEEEFRAFYKDRLTERREEVIKTAYFAGFFDWPRRATGSDVADLLDVSQPTVNRHIRKGERDLFDLVFEDSPSD